MYKSYKTKSYSTDLLNELLVYIWMAESSTKYAETVNHKKPSENKQTKQQQGN